MKNKDFFFFEIHFKVPRVLLKVKRANTKRGQFGKTLLPQLYWQIV